MFFNIHIGHWLAVGICCHGQQHLVESLRSCVRSFNQSFFWIITRALQTQLISMTAIGLAQTRTVMRLMRYLTQQASYNSSQAAALSKENHMCIDFVPSIPYVVPHFFGYPPGGLNWTYHVFLFLSDGRAAKTKGCKGNGL